MLLDRLFLNTTEKFPDNIAVVHGDMRISYSEMYSRALRLALILQEYGIRQGDRVLIALENSAEYITSYFAVLLAGGVTVAINPDVKYIGLQKIVLDCKPFCIIARSSMLSLIETCGRTHTFGCILLFGKRKSDGMGDTAPVYIDEGIRHENISLHFHDRSDGGLASIIYTSGTTGEPKGVMLSHKNLSSNTSSIAEYLKLIENDSVMAVLPFYYSYGNSLMLTHVAQGGKIVIDNSFMYPNVVLDSMAREAVTGFAGVPSTFAILLHRSKFRHMSIPSLRYITQAGGPMPHDTAFEIVSIVPQAKFFIMYGQTEASARLSYLHPDDLTRKPGSVGKGIPGVTLEVVKENGEKVQPGEVGEVTAQGNNIMLGYWGKEEETRQVVRNGRLYSGDMATVDEEGYIYLLGRRADMIKSGAHRIAPREIEEVVLKHPNIAEAAVVGAADPILGEVICLFVVVKDGELCSEKELRCYCRENLPSYKMPKTVNFVQSFHKTESGKIKKTELKSLLSHAR